MSFGAAAEASSGAALFCPRQGVWASQADHESVTRWLTSLTSAAKRLHGQPACLVSPVSRVPTWAPVREVVRTFDRGTTPQPLDHVSSHLIDLPPPLR